jgi:drug/metabolite transporter (DMT)-like permease
MREPRGWLVNASPEARRPLDHHHKSPGLGMVAALIGFSALPVGDALVKSMTGDWPGTAIATLRYIYGAAFLGSIILLHSGPQGFAVRRFDLQLGRGAAIAVSAISFFFAVQLMPLAEATSIQFTNPIMVALLSPWMLGEKASRRAWLCTLMALAGVIIILRPNLLELGPAALLPVLAALGMALLVIFNRKALHSGSVLALQFWVAALAVPVSGAVALVGHFSGVPELRVETPDPLILLKCLGVAGTGTLAHWLIYIGTQRASAPLIAPMVYVQLIVAGTLGWFLFGNGIDLVSAVGMAVIVLAGLLLLRSQRRPPIPVTPE